MDRPYIKRARIRNVGPIVDVTLDLSPMHALVGPNDAGKSSALRAFAWLRHQSKSAELLNAKAELHERADVEVTSSNGDTSRRHYRVDVDLEAFEIGTEVTRQALSGGPVLRLDPDALRERSSLIETTEPVRFRDDRGTGLGAIYDALLKTKLRESYLKIESDFLKLFPTVASLNPINPSQSSTAIGIKLKNGTEVGPEGMSEGMLYWLAFAALPHIDAGGLVLIEEPENGLHPARIAEVMRVLREVSKTTQVLLATHSPLVINEMKDDEVTVLTRDPVKGTIATPIAQTPNFKERRAVYALGELWLSYANGIDERPLLAGEPRE